MNDEPRTTRPPPPPHEDARSIEHLFAVALLGDEEDETAWAAIRTLQARGDGPVFEHAAAYLLSKTPKERGRAVDVLAQLGTPAPSPALRTKCADAILDALQRESVPSVVNSIGAALGHLRDPRAIEAMRPFANHDDAGVRLGVVMALTPHSEPAAIASVVTLSRDPDDDVRNWATFALGSVSEVDTPAIRDALVERLTDGVGEIRGEALVGLARRKDPRVLEPLRKALAGPNVGLLALEAAEEFRDPSLLPLLHEISERTADAQAHFRSVVRSAIQTLEADESARTVNAR